MPHDSPRLQAIIHRLKLDLAEVPCDAELGFDGLEDFTSLPFVTIDNEDSRDLDQALFIERLGDGWRVRYAIADASWFVRPGTPLFETALQRGSSFYFPGFAVPMLPRGLSEDIVSLNPDVDRRAVVFETELDADAEVVGTRIARAKIRSHAKLSYNGVQRWFDDALDEGEPWASSLRLMRDVGEARAARARRRGVIEFDRTEATVEHDKSTDRFAIGARLRNDVERWNEQLSLLCNTEGARLMREADAKLDDLQSVYRVHLPPLDRRLAQFREELGTLCERHDLDDSWRWDGQEPLADYLARLPAEPWRLRRAIELQVRYTNRASEYSDRVGPHFALAVEQYARFSAPMREIVGVFTHKEGLEAWGLEAPTDSDLDRQLRERVIDAGNEARKVQKRIDKEVMLLAIADFLATDMACEVDERPWRSGTVIGVRNTRAYILLDDVPLDLKLYAEDIGSRFETLGLGDGLALRVARYDEGRRRYTFDLSAP